MPSISVVVSVLNPPALTANFLHWLATDLMEDDVELIVVCDGDTNVRTHRLLRDAQTDRRKVRVVFLDQPSGYAVANNLAAQEACGDVLLFLNTDTFPTKGAIRTLAEFVKTNQDVGVAQGLMIYPQNLLVQSCGHIFGPFFNQHAFLGRSTNVSIVNQPADRQALSSAFYAVRRGDFIQNKGFDEFYLNSFEGMEFSLRMQLSGYRCVYRPEARAYHLQGGSRKHFAINEDQEIAYFWSKWGSRIRQDLDDILAAQMHPEHKKRNYLIVSASTNRSWKRSLDTLGLRGEYVATWTGPYQELLLAEILVPEIHRSNSPILFLTDSFRQLIGNVLWFSTRPDRADLVLDCHGNVVGVAELISPLPESIIYP